MQPAMQGLEGHLEHSGSPPGALGLTIPEPLSATADHVIE
jgi:hypothetical protein